MRIRPNPVTVALAVAILAASAAFAHLQTGDERPVNERGRADAAVTVIEYCNYDSDACARLHIVLITILRDYQDRVRLVFRYLPPPEGPDGSLERNAAFAAGAQGRFWEMHDMLFANRGRTTPADLLAMARQLRLDVNKFRADLNSPAIQDAAKRESEVAAAEGITEAPTVVINGQRLTNVGQARELRGAIQEALTQ
jgi:protein-disulfide isomerase